MPYVGERLTVNDMYRLALRAQFNEVMAFDRTQFALCGCWKGIRWHDDPAEKEYFEKNGNDLTLAPLLPGEFWTAVLHNDHPFMLRTLRGATFAVTKTTIHKHPRSFYTNILQYLEGPYAAKNPEFGHYMERFWLSVFSNEHILISRSNHKEVPEAIVKARSKSGTEM